MREPEIWENIQTWRERYRSLINDYEANYSSSFSGGFAADEIYREREQFLFKQAWEYDEVRPSDIVDCMDEEDDARFFITLED